MVKTLMLKCAGGKAKDGGSAAVEECLKLILLSEKYCSSSEIEVEWKDLGLTHLEESYIDRIAKYHLISLEGNQISYLPGNMDVLVNLERLDLSNNKLREFPASLLQLPCLQTLFLNSNLIESLPQTDAWSSSPLISLSVKGNLLTSLPIEINSKITFLNIANNKFKEFPMVICNMKTLEYLNISGNKDMKRLPIELGYNTNLTNIAWEDLSVSTTSLGR